MEAWHERSDEWLVALNEFHTHAREGLAVFGEVARRDVAQWLTRRREE